MPTNRTVYSGEFGDNSIDLVRGLLHVSPIEERSKYYNWYIPPHVHNNLFQIFIIETGALNLLQGDRGYPVQSPAFFSIPVNVSHGLDMTPDVTGWVISLSDAALENMLKLDADIFFRIDDIHITPLDLSNELVTAVYTTMRQCIEEYTGNLLGKKFALQYLVGMLMTRLYRVLPAPKEFIGFSDNANKIYYRRLMQLVRESNSFKQSVAGYAQALHITTGHLNRICRNVVNKSTKEVVLEFFINQSKDLLLNFELSIADISYQLNFEDPAYFTRLFKKKTGLTPKAFREQADVK
jgi:AraC-like DNA-binding protein